MSDTVQNDVSEKKGFKDVIRDSFRELGSTFKAFFKAPRALWGINIPYVLEGLVYFGILTILGKYASENVALADLHAGWVYSFVTGGITFAMLILGGVSDKLGIRRSLAIAFGVMFVGRALVAISGSFPLGSGLMSPMFLIMSAGLLLMVTGYGLYQPASYAGIKRYTNPQTAAMGYAVIYGLMNFGAFFSGFISPITRHHFESTFPPNGLSAVFWLYTVLTAVALITTLVIITKKTDKAAVDQVAKETAEINENNNEESSDNEISGSGKINNNLLYGLSFGLFVFVVLSILIKTSSVHFPFSISIVLLIVFAFAAGWEFLRHRPDHPFRDLRFVFFIFMLIPVQTLFAHNWLTLPYYLDRAFHGSVVSEYFELFSNLNPILIFVLAPVVAGLTARANVYKMMIYGTFVMAIPTFLLSVGPNMYLFLSYVLIMSVGEAMWQPRFLQWVAEIAPKGQTGAYMGIAQFPWFLTKVITGMYSGLFLAKYVPKVGPQNPEMMWLIYAVIAMSTPVILIMAKGWMTKAVKKAKENKESSANA